MSETNINNNTLVVDASFPASTSVAFNDAINDNDSRLTSLESSSSRIVIANFAVIGFIGQYETSQVGSFITFEAPVDFTLTTFQFTITDNVDNPTNSTNLPQETSDSGIMELALELYDTSGDEWNSILSVTPKIAMGTSDRGTTSNNATFSTSSISEGELIRVRPLQFKDTQGSFHILCLGEA